MAYQFDDRPQRILLPARLGFIAATVLIAQLLNLLPWRDTTGLPDWTALVLAFWCIHQPRKMGIGAAWMLGVIMDAANGALLGQHALAYSVLAFVAIAFSRRILWFPLWPQALHVFLLMLLCQLLMLTVRLLAGDAFPGLFWFLGSVVSALIWPAITFLLLIPQRLPESIDENRPL
ncbi:MAG: rod shape-determining protein MreD [Betaproteobacteria bacterium]|nr:rod shape-determining protein MreD [Betaproteobacteria bacterium]